MRLMLRMVWVPGVLLLAGGAAATYGLDRDNRRGGECEYIGGQWYCPCDETMEPCGPPDCILVDGQWICPV
jgi:hypothetical protein